MKGTIHNGPHVINVVY